MHMVLRKTKEKMSPYIAAMVAYTLDNKRMQHAFLELANFNILKPAEQYWKQINVVCFGH